MKLQGVGSSYPFNTLCLHLKTSWSSSLRILKQVAGFTSSLLQSFKARFGEFREHSGLFKFTTHPKECSLNKADLRCIPDVSLRDFEAEVADLKASEMWVNKFKSLNEELERIARQKPGWASKHMWTEMNKLQPEDKLILNTWNALPVTYHTLRRVSIAVLTMFGSTYSCEQSFSHRKNIKSNLRSGLTDESLNACVKLNLTKYQPDYKTISKSMQHQKSLVINGFYGSLSQKGSRPLP